MEMKESHNCWNKNLNELTKNIRKLSPLDQNKQKKDYQG